MCGIGIWIEKSQWARIDSRPGATYKWLIDFNTTSKILRKKVLSTNGAKRTEYSYVKE